MTTVSDARGATMSDRHLVGRLAAPAGVTAAILAATAFVAANNPHTTRLSPGCIMLQASGFYCPGCGGTRAVYDLVHGDIAAAARMNALVTFLVVPLGVLALAYWVLRAGGWIRWQVRLPLWTAYAAVAFMLAFTVVRNLPALVGVLSPVGA